MPADDRREAARLVDEVLPALIARLEASELGELEVRQGAWRVRLRRASLEGADAAALPAGRGTTRRRLPRSPLQPGAPASRRWLSGASPADGGALGDQGDAATGEAATADGLSPTLTPVGPGLLDTPGPESENGAGSTRGSSARAGAPSRLAARTVTSPGVGYYLPREGIDAGTRVSAGDLLGQIDVLGVRVEVHAPLDGVVGHLLVQPGEAVEYGQDLARIDPIARSRETPVGQSGAYD